MKKNNYFQPQTCVECAIPQMVILGESGGTPETGTLPVNPSTPGTGGGLGAPRKTV